MTRRRGRGAAPGLAALAGTAALIAAGTGGCATPADVRTAVASPPSGTLPIPSRALPIPSTALPIPSRALPVPSAAGTGRVGGASFSIQLAAAVTWTHDPDRVTDSGAWIRRWRYQPSGNSPSCVVTLGELPDYHGPFPAVELTSFTITTDNVRILRNEQIVPPPSGAVAAVRQEESFDSPASGTEPATDPVPGHLYARVALTTRHSLVAVYAAAPDQATGECRPDEIAASLAIDPADGGPASSPGGAP